MKLWSSVLKLQWVQLKVGLQLNCPLPPPPPTPHPPQSRKLDWIHKEEFSFFSPRKSTEKKFLSPGKSVCWHRGQPIKFYVFRSHFVKFQHNSMGYHDSTTRWPPLAALGDLWVIVWLWHDQCILLFKGKEYFIKNNELNQLNLSFNTSSCKLNHSKSESAPKTKHKTSHTIYKSLMPKQVNSPRILTSFTLVGEWKPFWRFYDSLKQKRYINFTRNKPISPQTSQFPSSVLNL